jgi:N-acetyl-gamma-glutamyl-phosphate reductase
MSETATQYLCERLSGKEADMIRAAVVGAAGYAGIELVRTLLNHPAVELVQATSDADAGRLLCDVYPALTGATELTFTPHDIASIVQTCDVAFLAVPHTAALKSAPELLASGVSVFDLSADYRLKDPLVYESWYAVPHTSPALLADAVYGQPELNHVALEALAVRKAAGESVLVGCAGCYPTATILATMPAFLAGMVSGDTIIVNALSGISGAGKGLRSSTHFCMADESVGAYSAASHRHTPEIEQALSQVAGHAVQAVFTPHLVPMKRGLLSTVTLPLMPDVTLDSVIEAYTQAYAHSPFVNVLGQTMPQTAQVIGTNNAQIGLACDSRTHTLIVSCAIDNLDKGAATQAVQCANIVWGLDESAGLAAVGPIV